MHAGSFNEDRSESVIRHTFPENAGSVDDYKIAEKARKTLHKSVMAFENVMKDPETSIPASLLNQSEGMVIFPSAFKLALGTAGGQGGKGIAVIRQEDGSWSNPFFVSLGEGSLGIQMGAQKSDIVLLFKNKNDIIDLDQVDIMLGTGVGVAAGPASIGASSLTDVSFEAEIYSYQSSKGLFAGVCINGGILSSNNRYNESLYGWTGIQTRDICNRIEAPYNEEVSDLIDTINMYGE